jgi:hypothetical protein
MKLEELYQMVLEKYDWTALKKDEWAQPVLISQDNVVLDGAHRVVAARALGKRISAIRIPFPVELIDPHTVETWLDKLVTERDAELEVSDETG